jgi:hypothetical protein
MRTANESQQIVIVDLEVERRKMLRTRRGEWEKGEVTLQKVAADTGGSINTPVDTTALLNSAIDVARSIGSNYDVTYTPSRTISDASDKATAKCFDREPFGRNKTQNAENSFRSE